MEPTVIGDVLNNELLPTHPLYNVPPKCVWQAYVHFQNQNKSSNGSRHSFGANGSNGDNGSTGFSDDENEDEDMS